jgi:TonB family protein
MALPIGKAIGEVLHLGFINQFTIMRRLSLLLFVLNSVTLGQDRVTVKEFFTKDDLKTDESNAFYYKTGIRIKSLVNEFEVIGSFIDTVKSFYTPSNVQMKVEVYNQDGQLNGRYLRFNENGKLKERGNFREGMRVGYFVSYSSEGKVSRILQYSVNPVGKNLGFYNDFKILNYSDASGSLIINNGIGYCNCYLTSDKLREDGKVINGLRDSTWLGYENDILVLKESYSNGDFINGVRYYNDKEIAYDKFEIQAEFPGGMSELYKFLNKNIRYPAYTRRYGINGKVIVQFVVEKDGSLSNVEIIKSLHESVDGESLRLVNMMPKWSPALQRGLPVKAKFVLPMTYKLVL